MSAVLIFTFLSYDRYSWACVPARENEDAWRLEAKAVAESSVMAWHRDKERQGPRAEGHGPAPRPQRWVLCFCFPSPLCCQKTPWGAAGPGGPGGSQAAAGQAAFPGGAERRKGNKCTLGAEGKTTGLANPRENGSLGETRAGVQEPGPWVLSHEELIPLPHPAPLCGRGSWACREAAGNQAGYRPWEHPPPTNPSSSRNGQPLSPADVRPYCPGFSAYEASGGKAGGSAQC